MRSWPALEVRVGPDPELLHAALSDFDAAAIDDNAADIWRVFFHTAEERDRAQRELTAFAAVSIDVPDEDWAARSQAALKAVQVGRLVIAPPWDTAAHAASSGTRIIVIQPSMGFGTGHHATTRLCLAALQQLDVRGRSVLDVGTGSGVLAIAANILGAAPVVAIDDDPDAVQAARENAGMNAGTNVDLRVEDLRTAQLPRFDVVLANLTGALLIRAAKRLHDVTTPGGHLIVSGVMTHEEADVRAALITLFSKHRESSEEDSAVVHRAEEDEWVCVTLENSSSS